MRKVLLLLVSLFFSIIYLTNSTIAEADSVTVGDNATLTSTFPLFDNNKVVSDVEFVINTSSDGSGTDLDTIRYLIGGDGCKLQNSETQNFSNLKCYFNKRYAPDTQVTIQQDFQTGSLTPDSFPTTYYYFVRKTNGGPYSQVIPLTLNQPSDVAKINLSASGAVWGKKGTITLGNLPKAFSQQKATITIHRNAGGMDDKHFSVFVNGDKEKSKAICSSPSGDDIFAFNDKDCSDGKFVVDVNYLVSVFPQPATVVNIPVPQASLQDTYTLSLAGPNTASTTLVVLYSPTGVTLEASQTSVTTGTKVSFTASGCPDGSKIDFAYGSDTSTKDVKDGKATFEKTLEGQGGEAFSVTATCQATGRRSNTVSVTIDKPGEERTEIDPPLPIAADTPFTIIVHGMESDGQCYFIEIKDVNADKYLDPGNRDALLGGDCSSGVDDGGKNPASVTLGGTAHHTEQLYDLFKSNNDTYTVTFDKGLPDGAYQFRLYTSNKGTSPCWPYDCRNEADDPHHSADLDFIIGNGEFTAIAAPSPACGETNDVGECTSVNTAIGPLPIQLSEFTKTIFSVLLSISGIIILYIVIRSGYILLFSQGNAEKVKEAQDRLTSAVVGLLFLIFSLIVLQTIGVDILHIPGFGA